MKRLLLIINTVVLFIFLGCGSSSKEARTLQEHQLKLVGIPQEIVINICQDRNDNGSCDDGELQAKVTVNKNDTIAQMWEKVKFDKDGYYVLQNYDPTLNIIMEIEDKEKSTYDGGELPLTFNPDSQELSVLQAMIDADFLSEEDTKAFKALDNREEIDKILLDSLRVNQNLLEEENLSRTNALAINLEEIAKGLIEQNISKELPEQLTKCKEDAGCIEEIVKTTNEEVELTPEEAKELARSKKIVDGYIIELKKPAEAECENGKKYLSSLEVKEKGTIVFEKFPVGINCTIKVASGATIDSNNNGKLDESDKVLGFDMVGSADDTQITPLSTLLFEKRKKGEKSDSFARMIQNFDPVTAPNRVVTNTGIEKVKIEKLIVLMEILKTSMKQFVDISALNLSEITTTNSYDKIENLDIDALISKFPSEVKTAIRERAIIIKKLIGIFKNLDSDKISLNTFFVSASDGGKSIEDALNESLLIPLPKGVSILDFVIKPVLDENANNEEVKNEEVKDEVKENIKEEIKNELISINSAPTANAGENKTLLVGSTLILDGSNSLDSDGNIIKYQWRENEKVLGEDVSITLNDLSVGTHVITLIVKDNKGAIGSDSIIVTITQKDVPINENNKPPVSDAGADQTSIFGNSVFFDGSKSSDSDGNIVAYEWRNEEGKVMSRSVTFSDSNLSVGVHTITLTITDDKNATSSDDVIITIKEAPTPNPKPVANAGEDQTVEEGLTVTLDASASTGDITEYLWTEDGTILSKTSTFNKNDFTVGTHHIILKVKESDGDTNTDEVIIRITKKTDNATN